MVCPFGVPRAKSSLGPNCQSETCLATSPGPSGPWPGQRKDISCVCGVIRATDCTGAASCKGGNRSARDSAP